MLVVRFWLSVVVLSALPLHAEAMDLFPPARVHHIGARTEVADSSAVLLTSPLVTAYAAVKKALATYWDAHPDQEDDAKTQRREYTIFRGPAKAVGMVQGNISVNGTVYDYAVLVQQDTAVAAIFTRFHCAPAQFAATQRTIQRAIGAVLYLQPMDSATVAGRNMAFVQAHRPELAADWREGQKIFDITKERIQDEIPN